FLGITDSHDPMFILLAERLKDINIAPLVIKINEPSHIPDIEFIDKNYNETIDRFKSMAYKDYLKTNHWITFKTTALLYFGNECTTCGGTTKLQVHHHTYINKGKETFSDVTVLCETCHKKFHDQNTIAL
ncbi:HNH endonuclease, partial [Clostridium algoriphilum]|uniref:HNH endonuclease n=1 Tax=Clostridium algoriphilum TaxID=198347 RepID=UPI001CF51F19